MWKICAEILLIVKGADRGQAVKILNRMLMTYSCRMRMEARKLEMTALAIFPVFAWCVATKTMKTDMLATKVMPKSRRYTEKNR